jgi:uncharacterized protein DUF4440
MNYTAEEALREVERRRLRSLVAAAVDDLDALHSPEFVLVTPSGVTWTREHYISGVLDGTINYRRFEPTSNIDVVVEGDLGVLRYRSAIDIQVLDQERGTLECWHVDCYRRDTPDAPWRVFWSQATSIESLVA